MQIMHNLHAFVLVVSTRKSLFNKVVGLCRVTNLNKRLMYRCFLMSFNKCLRAPSFVSQSIVLQLQNS